MVSQSSYKNDLKIVVDELPSDDTIIYALELTAALPSSGLWILENH